MTAATDSNLLETLLDAWDRNNRILVGLLRAVPEGGLGASAVEGGLTVAQLFNHAHYVRLVFVAENAPEFAREVPEEWVDSRDVEQMARQLDESARVVKDAVKARIEAARAMDRHFDHPILLFQLLTWHEGYHHGQIKLALKASGLSIPDEVAGPVTWGVWIRKTASVS